MEGLVQKHVLQSIGAERHSRSFARDAVRAKVPASAVSVPGAHVFALKGGRVLSPSVVAHRGTRSYTSSCIEARGILAYLEVEK